jgi:flagellar hook-associated protein 3 FlgL
MRVSTSQIYEAGSLNIQRNQGDVFKSYNQISTGRRILTPADDPVAAAQALVVTQSRAVTEQHITNQGNAGSQLALVDSQLGSLTDLLQNVRERIVQAGNTTLSTSDRESIAFELETRLSEMLGIANSDNGAGDFLFSGYQGATRPFAISGGAAIAPATDSPVNYFGDDGERLLQVSSSRQIAVNVAGSNVFMDARSGNGTFVTAAAGRADVAGLPVVDAAGARIINQGTGTIDGGSVLDQQQWGVALSSFGWTVPTNPALQLQFSVIDSVTSYQLFDVSDPAAPVAIGATPVFTYDTSTPPKAISAVPSFTAGQGIALASSSPPAATSTNFGSQVLVQGQPADNDTFTVTPSSSQSLFQTLQNVIGILRSNVGSTTYTSTQFTNDLGGQLTNIDQALGNVGQVQATVGTRMRELDSLGTASSDQAVQFSETLSNLQDLDYAKAISDFTRQQLQLEAAQKSFVQISGLTLFDYL